MTADSPGSPPGLFRGLEARACVPQPNLDRGKLLQRRGQPAAVALQPPAERAVQAGAHVASLSAREVLLRSGRHPAFGNLVELASQPQLTVDVQPGLALTARGQLLVLAAFVADQAGERGVVAPLAPLSRRAHVGQRCLRVQPARAPGAAPRCA